MGAILNANPVLHYSSAFLAGIGIKLLLDKFYISHAKRSIGFNWRYPPVTMSVLFGVFFIVSYVYVSYSNEILAQLTAHAFVSFKFLSLSFLAAAATIIYQTKLYTKNPIFSVALCAVSAFYLFSAISLVETEQAFRVFLFIAAAYLAMSVYLLCEQLKASSAESKVESKQEAELTLDSLENFRKWFKDDSTIKNTEQLEPDLQVYAKRITERLRTGGDTEGYEKRGAQHIALCGPFGCGKSSIVESIANDLVRSPKQDGVWIHSDISTWGAASGSVAHVVLSHIIDYISQYIDMCAFRALPKHYTEALKSGGSVFQFASTLLAGPVDIEARFQKLNDVLEVTNHKLLITLQDVDRGTGDESEKRLNEIAALLDRLKNKNLGQINFIIAIGNENEVAAQVISKATDYREDILRADLSAVINSFIQESLKEALHHNKVIILSDNMPSVGINPNRREDNFSVHLFRSRSEFMEALIKRNNLFIEEVNALNAVIVSIRQLKKVLRRVSQSWSSERLMGEVNLLSILMVCTLREVKPTYFTALESNYDFLVKVGLGNVTPIIKDMMKVDEPQYFKFFITMLGLVPRDYIEIEPKNDMELSNDVEVQKLDALNRIADSCGDKAKDELSQYHLTFNRALMSTQSLGVNDSNVNYLQKIIKESPLKEEINEQAIFSRIRDGNELESLAKELCCDEQYQLVLLRFTDVLFKRSSSFTDGNLNKVLFDYVVTEVKKNKYQNAENFKELFTRLVIKILNKNNFQSVIKEVASVNDIDLLLSTVKGIKKEAERSRSFAFIKLLEEQDYLSLGVTLLNYKVTFEILCILSHLKDGPGGELGNKYYGEPNCGFIFELLKDKTDEQSLKILIEVLVKLKHPNIYKALSFIKKEVKQNFINRLSTLENTGFRESERDMAINILKE